MTAQHCLFRPKPPTASTATFGLLIASALVVLLVAPTARGQSFESQSRAKAPAVYKHARFTPVELADVTIRDNHWTARLDNSRDVGVLDYLKKFEQSGYIDNFRIVVDKLPQAHVRGPNNNEFVYKLIEAAGYYAASSNEVAEAFGPLNRLVLAAQCDDGYLNTFYENPLVKKRGAKRFQSMNRFEFYNFGHFAQAAIAWYRTTGDDTLLKAAVKFADLIVEKFAAPNKLPYKLNQGPPNKKYEHPNHEMAMVELYRVTGDRRYLEFAKHTLDQYGFWDFSEIWGHAVQETLLMTGGADVYLEYGDQKMLETLTRLWTDMHQRKMYVTGGVGSTARGEAYGEAYQLPNRAAYSETCAAISLVFWNYRMLLATGESRYADCMERALYNCVMSGISLGGTEYSYRNPLECGAGDPNKDRRIPFHGCSCCPPNVHRLLASLQQYIYTQDAAGIQVHLYVGSSLKAELPCGIKVTLKQQTECPRSGSVQLAVEPQRDARFEIRLRKPGWVGDEGKPGDLYRYFTDANGPKPARNVELLVNGQPAGVKCDKGYVVINRTWSRGDVISLDLPMPVRRVLANEKVEADRGRVAIQRGPIIYCAEGLDNGGKVDDLEIPGRVQLKAKFRNDLLGGVTVLTGKANRVTLGAEGEVIDRKPATVTLIPYYTWANRDNGAMAVWLDYQR